MVRAGTKNGKWKNDKVSTQKTTDRKKTTGKTPKEMVRGSPEGSRKNEDQALEDEDRRQRGVEANSGEK